MIGVNLLQMICVHDTCHLRNMLQTVYVQVRVSELGCFLVKSESLFLHSTWIVNYMFHIVSSVKSATDFGKCHMSSSHINGLSQKPAHRVQLWKLTSMWTSYSHYLFDRHVSSHTKCKDLHNQFYLTNVPNKG